MLTKRKKTEEHTNKDMNTEDIAANNDDEPESDTCQSLLVVFAVFSLAFLLMLYVYTHSPQLSAEDAAKIKLPRNLDEAKALGRVMSAYKDDYFSQVVVGFVLTYVFLQSFAIPGSIFLSILSGFMFPFPLALFLVCLCSALGASFCYLLSSILGRKVVRKYFPQRVKTWRVQVEHHRHDMLSYITFLRITPFLPNWFINICAPVLNVSLRPFFLGTFLGVAPPSFGFVSAGVELYELTTTGDAFSFKSILIVIVCAVVSLLPVFFRRTLQAKIQ